MEIRSRTTGTTMLGSEFSQNICSLPITPELLDQYGFDAILEGPQATTVPPYQYSQRAGIQNVDGQWYTKYIAGPVFTDRAATETEAAQTAAEQEAAYKAQKDAEQATSVRASRKTKLADCDWTQLADAPVDKAIWATYRQTLRDVSAQAGFPWTIEWPTQPE